MTEYNRKFRSAFDKVIPTDSDEDFIARITERAEKMEKETQNKKIGIDTSKLPEYTEHKPNRVLNAVAGVAAGIAVISAGTFGLVYLNEHGGLKERGIESSNGAGYHEDTVTAGENVGDSRNLLEAAGDVLEFGDLTATIEKVEYDGHFLRVIYKADYHGERETDPKMLNYQFDDEKTWNTDPCQIIPYEYQETVVRHWYGTFAKVPELGDNYYAYSQELFTGVGEKIDNITFEYMPDGARTSEEAIHVGSYYIPGKEQEHICAVTDKPGIQGVTVSPLGVTIISDYDDDTVLRKAYEPQFFIINYKDGTHEEFPNTGNFMQLRLSPDDITPAERHEFDNLFRKSGISEAEGAEMIAAMPEYCVTYMMWLEPDTIDIHNIESVTIAGKEIAFSDEGASNSLVCAPSGIDERYFEETDITFDMADDIQAHISGYSYDGLMLIAKYELTYPEKVTNYPSRFPTFIDMRETTGEMPFFNNPRYSRFISIDGNKVVIERYILNRFADDSFDTLFINKDSDPEAAPIAAKEAAASGKYTVPVHKTFPDSPVIIRDLSEEMPDYTLPDGTVIEPEKLYISSYGVFIDFDNIDLPAWEKLCPNMQTSPISLTMTDGSEITIRSEFKWGMQGKDSTNYVGGLFDETIDTNEVAYVNIMGVPFCRFKDSSEQKALNIGQEFTLADGSKGIVSSAEYDGLICKMTMELHSTDPEYYEHYSFKTPDDPSYHLFLGVHRDSAKECGCGPVFDVDSDETGSVIRYSYFFVPEEKGSSIRIYIGDLTDHIERKAGYVNIPITVPEPETISTVEENKEFGKWNIKLSPLGFVIDKDNSDYYLDPAQNDWKAVFKDGKEEAYTITATGHYNQNSYYEHTFGIFDKQLDLDNINSISLFGQTVALSKSEPQEMYADMSAALDELIGVKTEYSEMFLTLRSYTPCGRFLKLGFEVEYKDKANNMMPIINFGEISWYPINGAPFDSKIYCANYELGTVRDGKADFTLTLYNELSYGEKTDTFMQSMRFDPEKPDGSGISWDKGPEITVYGFGTADSDVPAADSNPGTVIAENDYGSATLDRLVVSGAGVRLDVSYSPEVSEKAGYESATIGTDVLSDVSVVFRYKDGTEYRCPIADGNFYSDDVNHRRMFYLFDKNNMDFKPLEIDSITFVSSGKNDVSLDVN